jgi:glutaconate CoA-transferase subunit A
VVLIPAIAPDLALFHCPVADRLGNVWIGRRRELATMAYASRRVIVTAERIVDGEAFEATPEVVAIPGFLVDSVVEAPRGAWPCSCAGEYDYDAEYLAAYVAASRHPDKAQRFVDARIRGVLAGAA